MDYTSFLFRRGTSGRDSTNLRSVYDAIYNSQVTDITSRDQIINPYEIINLDMYRNTARGQALYEEDLNALLAIQAQQEASFQEFYNSAEQQALRESAAGRNPALSDISAGDAASANSPTASPVANIPTSGEIASQAISGIASLVSSAASIAALPTSFAQAKLAGVQSQLLGSQVAGQELNNLKSFEGLVYTAAAGRFADAATAAAAAGAQFDVDKFFADSNSFEGVFEAYAPEDSPRYRSAYNNAIKNVQKIKGEGYKLSGDASSNQSSFAEALSNPYYDSDLLSQIAIMEPVMRFQEDVRILNLQFEQRLMSIKDSALRVSGDTMLDRLISEEEAGAIKAKYNIDYFENFSGDEAALYDMYQKKFTALRTRATGDIYDNQWSIWKKDPLSVRGIAASYFITNAEHLKWSEYLATYGIGSGAATKVVDAVGDAAEPIFGTPEVVSGQPVSPASETPFVYKFGRFLDKYAND